MKPTNGRIVHFVMPNGQHRPAIIVESWGNDKVDTMNMGSAVNLQVFVDGSDDTRGGSCLNVLWKTSVCYDDTMKINTYHWPERS